MLHTLRDRMGVSASYRSLIGPDVQMLGRNGCPCACLHGLWHSGTSGHTPYSYVHTLDHVFKNTKCHGPLRTAASAEVSLENMDPAPSFFSHVLIPWLNLPRASLASSDAEAPMGGIL